MSYVTGTNKTHSMENNAKLWNSNIIITVHINIRHNSATGMIFQSAVQWSLSTEHWIKVYRT